MKELRFGPTGYTIPNPDPRGATISVPYGPPIGCEGVSIEFVDHQLDFALLHVDPVANSKRAWLQGRQGFPYVRVSRRKLSEGEPVYAFGYPLSEADLVRDDQVMVTQYAHKPRVTSAIVASTLETTGPIMTSNDPQNYVLDKALNFGNSGGPIIASDTGCVHAFCSRYQPVRIRQPHLGDDIQIEIPSLYGVVVSLANAAIQEALMSQGVEITDD